MGHTSLEDGESGKVDWLGGIVLRVASYSTSVMSSSLSGEETQGTMSGSFKLSVRHDLLILNLNDFYICDDSSHFN